MGYLDRCCGKLCEGILLKKNMKAKPTNLVRLTLLALLLTGVQCCDEKTVLYLLNVQPYPDNRSFAGWDRGFELIPAGRLAIEQINNQSDLLPGY